ncbi:MAG: PD-(D/E)XK nuclease family protein, partial [Phototrophicaceae bacterium]
EYDPDKLQRFRRSVLQHAPARVRAIRLPGQTSSDRVSKRQLGEIVHEALRWWRFPADDQDMSALLDSYAWKHGIIDAKDRDYAVMTARGWLRDFQHTMLYRNINQAQRVYRELPFVYRTEKRMIHGIIDVLFQTKEGIWTIADYKSSQVRGLMERNDDAAERENRRLLKDHAKRYVLQVGVYAAAVEQYLLQLQEDVYPELMQVFIHYLRHKETVRVTYKEWSDGLARLESQIGKLIIEDER